MQFQLENLDEFRTVLANHHISPASQAILDRSEIVLMVGPSSGGRNTIIQHLVDHGGFQFIVSDTTRPKRSNNGKMEQDGVEYWFRTESDMLEDLREGRFLEAAIIHDQQVSGISIRELQRAADNHLVGITDIETIGVDTIKAHKPDAYAIFVLPPSFEAWQERMQRRGDMSASEKRRRMQSAVDEFSHALEAGFYHFVVNDTVESSAAQVRQIVAGETSPTDTSRGHDLAEQLLADTRDWLTEQSPDIS